MPKSVQRPKVWVSLSADRTTARRPNKTLGCQNI